MRYGLCRSELVLWRLVGLFATVVCLVNIYMMSDINVQVKLFLENMSKSPELINLDVPKQTHIKVMNKSSATQKKEENNRTTDLSKIAIRHPLWLPVNKMDSFFNPEKVLSLGKRRGGKAYLVLGIPTVYRKKAYYLVDTVKWLVTRLPSTETNNVVIVIFVADFDIRYRDKVVNDMKEHFQNAVNDGLIQVISAPKEYYPDLNNLPLLYGDKADRVRWRSKQSLDYSFMYYYCAPLGEYYIQLEDDVLTEEGYFSKIKKYLEARRHSNWSIIEFGARGFIGMTYRSENLPSLARFSRFYFWTMPIDWIFRIYNDVYLYGNDGKNIIKPPIFKHVGHYSSLEGQVRKLDDFRKKKKEEGTKHIYQLKKGNPPGIISTTMKNYGGARFAITNPYGGAGSFWGKDLKPGDYIEIAFINLTLISQVVVASGNPSHLADSLLDTSVSISEIPYHGHCEDMQEVARFFNAPILSHTFKEKKEVSCVRLTLEKIRVDNHGRNRWLIIREIALIT